jgi:UDP-glucose:(glucosyl)LPS alpha-1,2-glucosyltransferase
MSLNIIDDTDTVSLGPSEDGTYNNANGGTELMDRALKKYVDNDLLKDFHIIKSRVRKLDSSKKNLLWLHDLWQDPEVQHLKDPEKRKRFDKLIFVSNWQLQTYNMALGVPYSEAVVLRNAIEPIEYVKKDYDGTIRLIYHTTPHRGLELLVPVFERLAELFGDKIHLDVFSSFEAYGWKERDKPYEQLFEVCKNHPQITYHGYQPNEVIREHLQKAHIFAYPSIWQETSCIAAIEALSAGCKIVCPNLAALPETTGGFAAMYQYHEDVQQHAHRFLNVLAQTIQQFIDSPAEGLDTEAKFQKNWADPIYDWKIRRQEWTGLLRALSEK